MTANVVGQSGKTVEVATLEDVNGDISNLPVATTSTTGVVKVGSNLSVSSDGTLSSPAATETTYGSVKIGSGITLDQYGAMTVARYTLPAATLSAIGGVKQGAYLGDLPAQQFTDIATAQTSMNSLVVMINALLGELRGNGVLGSTSSD